MNPQGRIFSLSIYLTLLSLIIGFGVRGDERHSGSGAGSGAVSGDGVSDNGVDPAKRAQIIKAYGELPLRFEANRGQTDARVKFISRNSGHTLFLTSNEAVLRLRNAECGMRIEKDASCSTGSTNPQSPIRNPQSATVKMRLVGANPRTRVIGLDELLGRSNYFLGADPRRWRTNIANYARVEYEEVYPGIDLIWRGNQKQLEHDFIVAPGANPRRIRLTFAGAQTIRIDERGELVLQTAAGEMRLLKSYAWQDMNGERRAVACEYSINGKHQIGLSLGAYDRSRELVIDPVLLYSSYIGGAALDQAFGVAVDKDSNAYIVGQTSSPDFPGASPIQSALNGGGFDTFVLKLNPSGNGVVYGTWLGGSSLEVARSVVVDEDGNAYVAGFTQSRNFPNTTGAAQQSNGGLTDGFIAKLNPGGSALLYSSYVGGDGVDAMSGIAIDTVGNAYLSGSTQSSNLPASGIQPGRNSQGIYKSADRAGNWAQIDSGLNTSQVLTVAVDPSNSSVLYAGTSQGVYKSMNGGQQWQLTGQANPAAAPFMGNVVVVHPSNPNIIFVGAQFGGIYRSMDGGQSYQANLGINFGGQPSGLDIAIDPATPATIYLGTQRGVFKTVNGGDSWTPINNGLQPPFGGQPPRVNRLAIDPVNPSTLYAATNIGVFKTVNGGGAWTAANNGLGQGSPQTDVLALAIDPSAPMTLYAGIIGFAGALFKTTDGGATWRASNTGLNFPGQTTLQNVLSLAIDPSAPATLYAGTAFGGVYKTNNGGGMWSASNIGLPNQAVSNVVVDRANPANVYAGVNAGSDAFVAKVNASGSAFVWQTYLGGAENDSGLGMAVDNDGAAYITGVTSSLNFPTASAFQAANGGGSDASSRRSIRRDRPWSFRLTSAALAPIRARGSQSTTPGKSSLPARRFRPICRRKTRCSLRLADPMTPSSPNSTPRVRRWNIQPGWAALAVRTASPSPSTARGTLMSQALHRP
ncbi:MAG: SBBP repeat-containing protein [Acidobacteria bacterium]|nr:SBBP repeat-containing protein [Acidobacteriota bacterium]